MLDFFSFGPRNVFHIGCALVVSLYYLFTVVSHAPAPYNTYDQNSRIIKASLHHFRKKVDADAFKI